ncbi:MAG: PDZ domain-containing protein [Planctomycetes bacterium]|nr:PDZ domain-containing protein [Planctomycetota bacterium]
MRSPLCRNLSVLALTTLQLLTHLSANDDSDVRKKVDKAVAKVYPALVQIHVVTVDYSEGRELKFEAAGSGAIISSDGLVVTNHHVAGKAKLIHCIMSNKEEIPAKLVGTDPLADISILRLDLSRRKEKKEPLPVAEFGDSDKLRVGDRVLAMGCPVALSQSVTMGIVSNLGFTIPKMFAMGFRLDGEEVGSVVKWIGFDAQIFPGNSGGPLVDLEGKIVGINEIGIGLGGAIPGNLAKEVAEKIAEFGHMPRSFLGLKVQPLLQSSTHRSGALVGGVMAGSPAESSGIKAGDIILKFDGKPVNVRFDVEVPDFNHMVMSTPIGKKVKLEVLREGKPVELEVTTIARENARGDEHELKSWGITARQLTDLSAKELKRSGKTGAYVWSVRPGGPAGDAKPAIQQDDVITSVGGKAVQSLEHLEQLTDEIVKGKTAPVPTVVGFDRNGEHLLTVVKLGVKDDDEKPAEVEKAWLPASYQVLSTDLAENLGLKGQTGIRITQVFPKSAAEAAGLKAGDIVTHLDGQKIEASQPEDIEVFTQMIRQYKIGTEAELTVLRGPKNEKLALKVKLPPRPKAEARMKQYKDTLFDFEARDVTYMDRIKQQWDEKQSGALVTAVQPGGWAALAKLNNGDLILGVDGEDMPDATALEKKMKAIVEARPVHVTFFVKRGIMTEFVEMEPAWKDK